jgi:hypothetical protein
MNIVHPEHIPLKTRSQEVGQCVQFTGHWWQRNRKEAMEAIEMFFFDRELLGTISADESPNRFVFAANKSCQNVLLTLRVRTPQLSLSSRGARGVHFGPPFC